MLCSTSIVQIVAELTQPIVLIITEHRFFIIVVARITAKILTPNDYATTGVCEATKLRPTKTLQKNTILLP